MAARGAPSAAGRSSDAGARARRSDNGSSGLGAVVVSAGGLGRRPILGRPAAIPAPRGGAPPLARRCLA
ncbi:MAG: hypothetical protein M3Y91_07055, partial [Actinomycetota bacterium]|nr:hypothetical protein [Actinomycetota bacterium]